MIAGSCLDTGKTHPGKNIVANWSLCQREVFYKVLIAFNMPESEAFFKILSTFKKQTHLHIDCKGAVGRWWCGATAENTLPLLLSRSVSSTFSIILEEVHQYQYSRRHLIALLPALLHIQIFVIVEGVVIKSWNNF